MSANNLQTNRNANRYFFATSENGEQTLGLQFGTTGGSPNLSTMAVTISGAGGNGVVVNTAPSFQATEYIFAEEGMGVYGSTYFTPSTLATSITGINLSTDRVPASGTACIESYSGNGANKGFEFLSRGVDSAVISTINADTNNYLSSIGRPGATASLGGNGTFITAAFTGASMNNVQSVSIAGAGCYNIQDLSGGSQVENRWSIGKFGTKSDLALFSYNDNGSFNQTALSVGRANGAMNIENLSSVNGVIYPQNLLSTLFQGTQGAAMASNTPTTLYTQNDVNTSNLIPGQNYLVDIPAILTVGPLAAATYLDIGVKMGGDGSFNYASALYIPAGGTPPIQMGFTQIADMGISTTSIEIVGYLHDQTGSISTSQNIGGALGYMKMIT